MPVASSSTILRARVAAASHVKEISSDTQASGIGITDGAHAISADAAGSGSRMHHAASGLSRRHAHQ
jgi:hypothetical protein